MRRRRTGAASDPADEPQLVFGPPGPVVIGTLVAAIVFAVVLEFLVIISFLGQRLWADPRLYSDALFLLPLLLWLAVLVASGVFVLRIITAWLQVDEHGYRLRGLCRTTVAGPWSSVDRVLAIQDIDRGSTPAEMLDAPENAYDGVYLMAADGHRILAVSSRLLGPRAQTTVLERAREAGVPIERIDAIPVKELRARWPHALVFMDRHPVLLLLAGTLFYVAHNVLTFWVWGL